MFAKKNRPAPESQGAGTRGISIDVTKPGRRQIGTLVITMADGRYCRPGVWPGDEDLMTGRRTRPADIKSVKRR